MFQDGNSTPFLDLFLVVLRRLPAMMMAAYTFNDVLIPRFYGAKKYLAFGVLSLVLFYVTSVFDRILNVYVFEPLFREPPFAKESILEIVSDLYVLISFYLNPLLFASLAMTFQRLLQEKRATEKRNAELERDKNRAELNALKSQLHPHFLFNTLNNIYALTVQKSDKAPETVATLSEMLDYILYQCNDTFVSLQKEVNLLENYMALERLRYGDDIEITTEYDLTKSEMKIAPLLLLSILENAFKHGASGSISIPKIQLKIWQEDVQLYVEIKNTKNTVKQQDDTGYSKGIGVVNIQQQLAILYTDFTYDVTDKEEWYTVSMRINTQAIND